MMRAGVVVTLCVQIRVRVGADFAAAAEAVDPFFERPALPIADRLVD